MRTLLWKQLEPAHCVVTGIVECAFRHFKDGRVQRRQLASQALTIGLQELHDRYFNLWHLTQLDVRVEVLTSLAPIRDCNGGERGTKG